MLAHFGTFDVENYGDLLFPLVLERRLAGLGCEFVHVSPRGGPPVWGDCRETVSTTSLLEKTACFDPAGLDAVVVGGGHIIQAARTPLVAYQAGDAAPLTAYPGLWLGAAHVAARTATPLCWNAPGVPRVFRPAVARLARWSGGLVDYLALRDPQSLALLRRAGVKRSAVVAPDTAWDVSRLWSAAELDAAFRGAFQDRGRAPVARTITVHVKARYLDEDVVLLAARLDRICRRHDATPVLLALGPCHGDDRLARRLAAEMTSEPLLVDRPRSLRECAALIRGSIIYLGSSLHGLITALSFGTPGLVVAREAADGSRKFSGMLDMISRPDLLAPSWREVDQMVDLLLDQSPDAWREPRRRVDPLLDEHWMKLRSVVEQGREPAQRAARREKCRRALARFERLGKKHFGGVEIFQGVLLDEARQAVEARRAAKSNFQKLDELRGEYRRLKSTVDDRVAAVRTETADQIATLRSQAAEARAELRRTRQGAERLTRWLEDVESGVAALLDSRRWRLGNWVGDAVGRLLRRPTTPMATDLFDDVFARFRAWRDEVLPDAVDADIEQKPAAALVAEPSHGLSVDIVICVHNALDDTAACLDALERSTRRHHRLILVDDGSAPACAEMLRRFAEERLLLRNEQALGYTRAANQALRVATADYVVLLNSDTIVTPGWLERLIECGESDPRIGLVGPISNAASWQSAPQRFTPDGDWAVNSLPEGTTPDDLAERVAQLSERRFPRVPLLNGFCLAIKRSTIETVGLFDEENFPQGYGEENDYCLRAAAAGLVCAVADHAYVHHAKSRSYTHRRRAKLTRRGQAALARKHGARQIAAAVEHMRGEPVLAKLRARLADALARHESSGDEKTSTDAPRVLFLLPVRGGGGGAHSVVQEARAMRALGAGAMVAVDLKYRGVFREHYPGLSERERDALFFFYRSAEELTLHAATFDVVVATVYFSVELLKKIIAAHPHVLPAYYVQDYEPRFFRRGSRNWRRARASYALLPEMVHFAKTDWIRDQLRSRHGVEAAKVAPSLDHDVFYPSFIARPHAETITLTTMIRPSTPYRGAARSMRLFRRLHEKFGLRVDLHLFGCDDAALAGAGLERDFAFTNHGPLTREAVAGLLRASEVFLDASDYQAFGRTGLEAMASGAAVVLPVEGGVSEYALDGENAVLVDTSDEQACFRAIVQLVENETLRRRLQAAGPETATRFSVRRAALSELSLFSSRLAERRASNHLAAPPSVHVESSPSRHASDAVQVDALTATTVGDRPTGSAYIRVLAPLGHRSLAEQVIPRRATLDQALASRADIVLVQRDAVADLEAARLLVRHCRRSGKRLVYEIDDHLFALPASHAEQRRFLRAAPAMRFVAEAADLVTVPTPALADVMRAFNPAVEVLPNALDESLWFPDDEPARAASARRRRGPVRILAMGTRTHEHDLRIIEPALRRVVREFGARVRFEMIGCVPPGARSTIARAATIPRGAAEYPAFVRWLRRRAACHIGLAPLAPTSLNACKSGLKYLDYAALGLAGVFSEAGEYPQVVQTLDTGLVTTNDVDSWYEVLKLLIEDDAFRDSLATRAERDVRRTHTLQTRAVDWGRAYARLVGRELGGRSPSDEATAERRGDAGIVGAHGLS